MKTERSADYVRQTLKRREIQIININFSQNTRLKCMKHYYQVQTVLERGGGCTFDWEGEGVSRRGFETGSKFFFTDAKMIQGLYFWVCVSVLLPRIETLQGGLPSNFIVTLEGSSTEFLVAVPFRIGTQIGRFFFFFLFFKWLFWVVLNILSTNELKKKKLGICGI